jgi:hypothetical protein
MGFAADPDAVLIVPAATEESRKMSQTVSRWGRFEVALTSDQEWENPLQEAELAGVFVSPSGQQVAVDGFWDGGRTWRLRFSPDEEGEWRFRARLSDGVEQEGQFVCGPAEGETPFQRHGHVRVHEGRKRLEHAAGTPFFWLVDTAWNGPLRSDEAAWQWYAEQRVRQGFSGVQWVTTQWRAAQGWRCQWRPRVCRRQPYRGEA